MCYGNVILLWCLLNGEPPTEKENIGKKSKKKFYILTFKCFHMLWCRNPHLKQMEFEWSYNGLAYLRSKQLTFVYTQWLSYTLHLKYLARTVFHKFLSDSFRYLNILQQVLEFSIRYEMSEEIFSDSLLRQIYYVISYR